MILQFYCNVCNDITLLDGRVLAFVPARSSRVVETDLQHSMRQAVCLPAAIMSLYAVVSWK